jgi:hypothetical protein
MRVLPPSPAKHFPFCRQNRKHMPKRSFNSSSSPRMGLLLSSSMHIYLAVTSLMLPSIYPATFPILRLSFSILKYLKPNCRFARSLRHFSLPPNLQPRRWPHAPDPGCPRPIIEQAAQAVCGKVAKATAAIGLTCHRCLLTCCPAS